MDLGSGKTLYELNPDHFFVPASNTKLFTTALALTRLGPDFTFQTRVLADAPPDALGPDPRLALRLVGGGDPNLSARAIPYRMGPVTGNPLAAIEDLADQVVARGVKRVRAALSATTPGTSGSPTPRAGRSTTRSPTTGRPSPP